MWLGMEMVLEDYVQDGRVLQGLLLNTIFTAFVCVAAFYAILRIFFGADGREEFLSYN